MCIRDSIMAVLEGAKGPVSGSALAREVGVSRQIVVQDIALPVSYTHLDVYKRQAAGRPLIAGQSRRIAFLVVRRLRR